MVKYRSPAKATSDTFHLVMNRINPACEKKIMQNAGCSLGAVNLWITVQPIFKQLVKKYINPFYRPSFFTAQFIPEQII